MNARQKEQFRFLELMAAYEGLVTNKMLRDQFNIKNVQASRIITGYIEVAPNNLKRHHGTGRGNYGPTHRFNALFSDLSVSEYLRVRPGDSSVVMEDSSQDMTQIDPKLFRSLFKAIKSKEAASVIYHSMTNPEGVERTIHPLAFAFAGKRWHLRAYDELKSDHRDFNLARISSITQSTKMIDTPRDDKWETFVETRIRAHPDLTTAQQKVIRDEFFNGAALRVIKARSALKHYVLRDLEVAVDIKKQKPPEYQLALLASDE